MQASMVSGGNSPLKSGNSFIVKTPWHQGCVALATLNLVLSFESDAEVTSELSCRGD